MAHTQLVCTYICTYSVVRMYLAHHRLLGAGIEAALRRLVSNSLIQ